MAQLHAGRGQREVAQDRVEPHLRAGLQPHRAPGLRLGAGDRRTRDAAELVAGEARDEHRVAGVVARERAVVHLVGDAPAPAELHGADVHLVHLRRDDGAVALLDQQAGHAAPAELARERQTDRPAADDQNRNFLHSTHSQVSCSSWPSRRSPSTAAPHCWRLAAMKAANSCGVPGCETTPIRWINACASRSLQAVVESGVEHDARCRRACRPARRCRRTSSRRSRERPPPP